MRLHYALAITAVLVLTCIAFACAQFDVPTIPKAKLETPEPIGTIYWGEPANGLRAGLAVKGPGGGEGEKILVGGPRAPGVKLSCTLMNVSDRPIRLLHPFRPPLNDADVLWMSPSGPARSSEYPGVAAHPITLEPGDELTVEREYRARPSDRTPYERTLQFEYSNAVTASLHQDGQGWKTIDGLWTGRVTSGVLPVKVK